MLVLGGFLLWEWAWWSQHADSLVPTSWLARQFYGPEKMQRTLTGLIPVRPQQRELQPVLDVTGSADGTRAVCLRW